MNSAILSLPLRGLTDGTDGLDDVFLNLTRLGFELGSIEQRPERCLKISKLPEGWGELYLDRDAPLLGQDDIVDEKGYSRISFLYDVVNSCKITHLLPRFKLQFHAKKIILLDEELGNSDSLTAAEIPITRGFYKKNLLEIDAIIDTHLPNLRNPFDHWGQDRTRAIQSLQKELGILVQSTPKKAPTKKNLSPAP